MEDGNTIQTNSRFTAPNSARAETLAFFKLIIHYAKQQQMAAAMTQLASDITQGLDTRFFIQSEYKLCLRMKDTYIFCNRCFYKMHDFELKENIQSRMECYLE